MIKPTSVLTDSGVSLRTKPYIKYTYSGILICERYRKVPTLNKSRQTEAFLIRG